MQNFNAIFLFKLSDRNLPFDTNCDAPRRKKKFPIYFRSETTLLKKKIVIKLYFFKNCFPTQLDHYFIPGKILRIAINSYRYYPIVRLAIFLATLKTIGSRSSILCHTENVTLILETPMLLPRLANHKRKKEKRRKNYCL